VAILRSTLAGNYGSATIVPGYGGSSLKMTATVVSAPHGGCSTSTLSGGWNVVNDASCGLIGPNDRQGVAVVLGPLAANGGPTLTHLLGAGSAMVDAIPFGTVGVCDASTPVDQRNVARPAGAGCDVGAVEGTVPPAPGATVPEVPDAPAPDGSDAPVPGSLPAPDPVTPEAAEPRDAIGAAGRRT